MPPTLRDGLLFVDDSQIFPSLDAMVAEFAAWGKRFAPAPVSFQFGYQSDRPWWVKLEDPPGEIGRRILAAVPNTESLIWVDFSVLEVFPPEKAARREAPIVGVKIYDHKGDVPSLFDQFAEVGVNTVFCSEALAADAGFRLQARDRKIKVFVIEPIFFDAEALKADPGLYAITSKGERAKEDWVEFVCPTRDQFRKRKIAAVRDAVQRLQPDGVSLDFIRYFVYWEMVHPDRTPGSLPDTCYCPHCLARFQAETASPAGRREDRPRGGGVDRAPRAGSLGPVEDGDHHLDGARPGGGRQAGDTGDPGQPPRGPLARERLRRCDQARSRAGLRGALPAGRLHLPDVLHADAAPRRRLDPLGGGRHCPRFGRGRPAQHPGAPRVPG